MLKNRLMKKKDKKIELQWRIIEGIEIVREHKEAIKGKGEEYLVASSKT